MFTMPNVLYLVARLLFALVALGRLALVGGRPLAHLPISPMPSMVLLNPEHPLWAVPHHKGMHATTRFEFAIVSVPDIPTALEANASLSMGIDFTSFIDITTTKTNNQVLGVMLPALITSYPSPSISTSTDMPTTTTNEPPPTPGTYIAEKEDQLSFITVSTIPLVDPVMLTPTEDVVAQGVASKSTLAPNQPFSQSIPQTTTIPNDGHPVDSETDGRNTKDKIADIAVLGGLLTFIVLTGAYKFVKDRLQSREATEWDENAYYEFYRLSDFVSPHPMLIEHVYPPSSAVPYGSTDPGEDRYSPWSDAGLYAGPVPNLTPFKPAVCKEVTKKYGRGATSSRVNMYIEEISAKEKGKVFVPSKSQNSHRHEVIYHQN